MEKEKQKSRPLYLTDTKYKEVCEKAHKKGLTFGSYVKSKL